MCQLLFSSKCLRSLLCLSISGTWASFFIWKNGANLVSISVVCGTRVLHLCTQGLTLRTWLRNCICKTRVFFHILAINLYFARMIFASSNVNIEDLGYKIEMDSWWVGLDVFQPPSNGLLLMSKQYFPYMSWCLDNKESILKSRCGLLAILSIYFIIQSGS